MRDLRGFDTYALLCSYAGGWGHAAGVLCLSDEGGFVASGGRDGAVGVGGPPTLLHPCHSIAHVAVCVRAATQLWRMPSAAEIDEHRQSAAAQELDSAQRVREGYGQLDNPVPYPMDSIMVLRGHSGEVSYVKLAGRHVISAASDGAVKVRGASADSWCSCDPLTLLCCGQVWNAESGMCEATLWHFQDARAHTSHAATVRGVCLFRDMIVTCTAHPHALWVRRPTWGRCTSTAHTFTDGDGRRFGQHHDAGVGA